jgi:hypothetical protein
MKMNQSDLRPFDRRGRELRLTARPLLVLSRYPHPGNHTDKNQNQKPFTRISLQSRERLLAHTPLI